MAQEMSNNGLVVEIKSLIEQSKQQLAVTVNATLSLLYWQIGNRINEDILQNQRAEYGKEIVSTLSRQLTLVYGQGWSKRQLHHCIQFADVFPDVEIVHTLCSQLSWSHLRLIIPMEDKLKRAFYIEMKMSK